MSNMLNVIEILTNAGWFEGRKINTSDMEKRYKEFGYEVFPTVLKFLEEFGMLNIVIKRAEKLGEKEDRHHTNPQMVIGAFYKYGKFKAEESYAGERLVPVGEVCNENLLLFISETGKIYHGSGKLGDTPWEAWETLINDKGFKDWGELQRERG